MFRPISWRKQAEKAERRTRYCELSEFSFSTARITTETKAGVISAAPHARFIATEPTSGKSTRNGCFWYTRRESNPNLRLRRPPFYPLYYECISVISIIPRRLSGHSRRDKRGNVRRASKRLRARAKRRRISTVVTIAPTVATFAAGIQTAADRYIFYPFCRRLSRKIRTGKDKCRIVLLLVAFGRRLLRFTPFVGARLRKTDVNNKSLWFLFDVRFLVG